MLYNLSVRDLFLALTSHTVVYGEEEEYFGAELRRMGFEVDDVGNYHVTVGEGSTVMFTSHLDTAAAKTKRVTLKQDERWVYTNGDTILGADDKAGVTVMLKMIEAGVPGLYYFFVGEEVGRRGSEAAAEKYAEQFKQYTHCISFDRKGYGSIITKQSGTDCTSTAFARALSTAFAREGLFLEPDPTGSFTDSYSFTELISECTNISVGYFNAHQNTERQDLYFLEALTRACIRLDWSALPAERKPEPRFSYRSYGSYGGQQRLLDDEYEGYDYSHRRSGYSYNRSPVTPNVQASTVKSSNLVTPANIKDMTGLDVLCLPTRDESVRYVSSQFGLFMPAWLYSSDKIKVPISPDGSFGVKPISDIVTLARRARLLVLAAETDPAFYQGRVPESFVDNEWDAYRSLSSLVWESRRASVVQGTLLIAMKFDYYESMCDILTQWYRRIKDSVKA